MGRTYTKNRAKLIDDMTWDYGYIFCQKCQTSNAFKFECHHIIFRSEAPNHPKLHDKANLIIVCSQCHNDLHNHKHIREGLVKERKLDKLFGLKMY